MCSTTTKELVEEALEAMEEVEDLAKVTDRLSATTVDNKDTTRETVPTLPLHVSIASLTIILLKNAIFCKLRCRTRDRRWEIRMYS